jgi:hypothetical protein
VEVAVSPQDGRAFPGALVWRGEDVRVGLPVVYAAYILDTVGGDAEVAALGPGTLRLDRAAHGAISSSQMWFALLALRVVRLLASGQPAEAEMARLLAAASGGAPHLRDL